MPCLGSSQGQVRSNKCQDHCVLVQSQFAYIQLFFTLKSLPLYREEIPHNVLEMIQSIFDLYFVNQDRLTFTDLKCPPAKTGNSFSCFFWGKHLARSKNTGVFTKMRRKRKPLLHLCSSTCCCIWHWNLMSVCALANFKFNKHILNTPFGLH